MELQARSIASVGRPHIKQAACSSLRRHKLSTARPDWVPCSSNDKEAQIVESWDLVVLEGLEGRDVAVARVVSAGETLHMVEILDEEGSGEFAASGEEQEIAASQVLQVIKNYDYSQRQVDRVHNPHGEHAEEVFTIPDAYWPISRKHV